MLGGAVVAGDGDNTAIYYNPATIAEMSKGSNFSIAANLFSWNFYTFRDALGDDIDLVSNNFLVQPQFISYTYSPQKIKGISFAFAALTRVKEKVEMGYVNATYKDVIKRYPGEEKYNTTYRYRNDYSDSWVGGAFAHQVTDKFSYGVSLFVSFSSLIYYNEYGATAYNPNDTSGVVQYKLSEGSYTEEARFTDYRLVLKIGFAYKHKRWRFGLNFSMPNINVFSTGKSATRVAVQSNITYEGVFLSDYIIFDGQSKSELKTNYKLPFSVAGGFIYDIPNKGQRLYFTAEYFARIKGYKMVDAQINTDITTPPVYEEMDNKDWLSFAYGAQPVINAAIGYSWTIKKDLVFLNAFRTDFSSVNDLDLGEYSTYNFIKTTNYNIYHYSAGLEFNIKSNRFIAGGDVSYGHKLDQKQFANFSDPVEYDPEDNRALQGPLKNTASLYYFGFSVYIGATLNFAKKTEHPEK